MLVHKPSYMPISMHMPTPKKCLEYQYHTAQCTAKIYGILIGLLCSLKTWVFSDTLNFKQILMWCECLV